VTMILDCSGVGQAPVVEVVAVGRDDATWKEDDWRRMVAVTVREVVELLLEVAVWEPLYFLPD